MPAKLATTVKKIETVHNMENSKLINRFHEFMKSNSASERHQNNNLKSVISFANFLGPERNFTDVNTANQILAFLNSKIKSLQDDPEKRSITTWNDYLHRIKHFLRWLYNTQINKSDQMIPMEEWITPSFLKIKEKRTK